MNRSGTFQIEALESRIAPSTIIGLTTDGHLIQFKSEAPGTLVASVPITGLAEGEHVVAIDFHPATGQLHGLTDQQRLYRLSPTTGSAYQPFRVPFWTEGPDYDLELDPMSSEEYVGSSNHLPNPYSGSLGGMAYENAGPATSEPSPYVIDAVQDRLWEYTAGGAMILIGGLGADLQGEIGFDISGANIAFLSSVVDGVERLYTVDVASGAATLVGPIGTGQEGVRDIAVVNNIWSQGFFYGQSWTQGRNWASGIAPSPGDQLVIKNGVSSVNNFPAGTPFHSIILGGGSDIHGNSIRLETGIQTIDGPQNPTHTHEVGMNIEFGSSAFIITGKNSRVTFTGSLDLRGNDLILRGDDRVTLDQTLIDSVGGAGVIKSGTGFLHLQRGGEYSGDTILTDGTLFITGSIPNSFVEVQGGVLSLTGLAKQVKVLGGTFEPYRLVPQTTASGDLHLAKASTFLTTTSQGVAVTGTVSIDGAALDVEFMFGSGTMPMLIRNDGTDPVQGTFAGLPEGTIFWAHEASSLQKYMISYQGGDGNDVTLTKLSAVAISPAAKRVATFTDVDGDFVTIRIDRGYLEPKDFVLYRSGDGYQLLRIDAKSVVRGYGANWDISVKQGPEGDGLVNIGEFVSDGVPVGKVRIKGNLGRIDVHSAKPLVIKSLVVNSLGRPLSAQIDSNPLDSFVGGSIGKLVVRTEMSADFQATGRIGAVEIGGSLIDGALRAGTAIGKVKVGGDVANAVISALGRVGSAKASHSIVLNTLQVKGAMRHSQVLAGYNLDGVPLNPDAQIRGVAIGGDFEASSIVAGVASGDDGLFGTPDDVAIGTGTRLLSQIASIRITGALKTTTSGEDHFGIVAQRIAAAHISGSKLQLNSRPEQEFSLAEDLALREVSGS